MGFPINKVVRVLVWEEHPYDYEHYLGILIPSSIRYNEKSDHYDALIILGNKIMNCFFTTHDNKIKRAFI